MFITVGHMLRNINIIILIIQVWSPFALRNGSGGISSESEAAFTERPVYTHEEYINLVLRSGLVMSHDYSSQSVEEDPRMMAFFDSLVQRELEYWSSDEDLSSNEIELYDSILQVTRRSQQQAIEANDNETLQPEGNGHTSDSSDNSEFSPFTLAFASVMAAQETDASRVLDAHDESERLRAAVQEPLELSPGRSSSRRNRKSISEIIAQNRKEVMRAAEMRHRNMRLSIHLHANILSSSSSDSDSDDQTASPSVRVEDVSQLLNTRRALQHRTVNRLKRLQALRTRLVTSDTDNSGDESPPRRKRRRMGSNSSKEEVQANGKGDSDSGSEAVTCSKSSIHSKAVDHGASTSQVNSLVLSSVGKGKTAFEHEAGPYLQQADGPGLSSHLPPLPSATSGSHADPVASTSGTSSVRHTEESPAADDQNSSTSVNRDNSHSIAGPTSSEAGHDSDGEPSQPVWNEFKRFKKRLQRATRFYRQKVNTNNDSSDDD